MAVLTCSTRVTHRLHRRGRKTDEERRNSSIGAPGGDPAPLDATARHAAAGKGTRRSAVQGAFEQGTKATKAPSGHQDTVTLTYIYTLDYIPLYVLYNDGDSALFRQAQLQEMRVFISFLIYMLQLWRSAASFNLKRSQKCLIH